MSAKLAIEFMIYSMVNCISPRKFSIGTQTGSSTGITLPYGFFPELTETPHHPTMSPKLIVGF
jgi:hypothetical protein